MAGFLGGYALVWSAFGALALVFDLGLHRGVDSIAWLREHDWLIGGVGARRRRRLSVHGAQGRLPDELPPPGQFMLRHYRRGVAGGLRSARATGRSVWAAAGR